MRRKLWSGGLPLGFVLLTFFILAPSLIVTACTSSDQPTSDTEVIPPPGVDVTIPADFPEAEATMLRALAFTSDDLPDGFELQFEDASDEDAGIFYVAKYFNTNVDEGDIFQAGLITADVFVLLANDRAGAQAIFDQMSGMSEAEMIDYTRQQGHWSDDPALADELEQVDIDASRLVLSSVSQPAMGWLTIETVRIREIDEGLTIYDTAIAVQRGRVFGMVALGSAGSEPDQQDVEDLANELADRIAVLSP